MLLRTRAFQNTPWFCAPCRASTVGILYIMTCKTEVWLCNGLQRVRAQVIDFELQRQLAPYMRDLQPLPGVYDPDFIAANQGARADNVVKGSKQVMRLPLVSCISS